MHIKSSTSKVKKLDQYFQKKLVLILLRTPAIFIQAEQSYFYTANNFLKIHKLTIYFRNNHQTLEAKLSHSRRRSSLPGNTDTKKKSFSEHMEEVKAHIKDFSTPRINIKAGLMKSRYFQTFIF